MSTLELVGVSKSYAYQLAKDGTLPVVRLGRRVLVPVESQGVVAVAALGERVEVVGRVTGGPQEGRHG